VAIANALQLEAARRHASPFTLYLWRHAKFEVAESIHCRIMYFFAADTLLYAVTLTFDLWPWTFAAYRLWPDETLYHIWTQSSNARRSYCGVIAISVFDLMTLNIALRVALGSWITFTKFDLRQLIHALIIAFFDADTLCHAGTLTFDLLLTLKFYSISGVMRLNSVHRAKLNNLRLS